MNSLNKELRSIEHQCRSHSTGKCREASWKIEESNEMRSEKHGLLQNGQEEEGNRISFVESFLFPAWRNTTFRKIQREIEKERERLLVRSVFKFVRR